MATRRELGIALLDRALQKEPKPFLTGKIIVRDPHTLDNEIPVGEQATTHGVAPEFTRLGRLANAFRIFVTKRDKTGILGTQEQRAIQIALRQEWRIANKKRYKKQPNVIIFERHTLAGHYKS